MPSYTVAQLEKEGPQYAMAMLLKCLKEGEAFVTYGAICAELEYQLGIAKIFPTQIGSVAGALMDSILEVDPKAPLLNAIITRPDGLPGRGVGGYFAEKYNNDEYIDWNQLPRDKRIKLVENERNKILLYKNWNNINKQLFDLNASRNLRSESFTEKDGKTQSSGHGGEAESSEHKKLKRWVAKNPQHIRLKKSFGKGDVESRMMSGDIVDVLFSDGNE